MPAMMPNRAPLVPVGIKSRRQTRYRAVPWSSKRSSGAEQNTRASINGICPLLRQALCRSRSDRNFFALVLVAINGLLLV